MKLRDFPPPYLATSIQAHNTSSSTYINHNNNHISQDSIQIKTITIPVIKTVGLSN